MGTFGRLVGSTVPGARPQPARCLPARPRTAWKCAWRARNGDVRGRGERAPGRRHLRGVIVRRRLPSARRRPASPPPDAASASLGSRALGARAGHGPSRKAPDFGRSLAGCPGPWSLHSPVSHQLRPQPNAPEADTERRKGRGLAEQS